MSILDLCYEPHPVLHAQARPVTQITGETHALVRNMIETMYAHDGIGLAAPQVGCDLQIFIASPAQQRGKEIVVLNPRLEPIHGQASIREGCLSLPNVWDHVRRSEVVRLRGQNLSGKPISLEVDGLLAIVFQHEVDHLEGRLFIDHLSWFKRRRALAKLKKQRFLPDADASRPTPD